MEMLSNIVRDSSSDADRLAALSGYLSMVKASKETDPEASQAIYKDLWSLARTLEERELIVRSVGEAAGTWVLAFLESLLSDTDLAGVAEEAYGTASAATARLVDSDSKGCPVTLKSPYVEKYSAGGKDALTDGKWGSDSSGDGCWQGFEGNDLEAVIDLGREIAVDSIRVGFLRDMGSWIFLPLRVEFLLSPDGESYERVDVIEREAPTEMEDRSQHDFYTKLEGQSARFVKVFAKNIGVCPDWHSGSGGLAWLFVDEIQVNPHLEP